MYTDWLVSILVATMRGIPCRGSGTQTVLGVSCCKSDRGERIASHPDTSVDLPLASKFKKGFPHACRVDISRSKRAKIPYLIIDIDF